MERRDALRGLTYAGFAVGVGATAPSAHASEHEEAEPYDTLKTTAFPQTVTISWVTDRFIQVQEADAPVVGHTIESSAFVLERIQSVNEHNALREEFDWGDVDYTDADVFDELLRGVAWPLDTPVSTEFFDTHDLLWISGLTPDEYRPELANASDAISTDQEFYRLYGHTPFLFGAIPSDESLEPGTVVDLSATVRHTGTAAGPIGSGSGGYLEVKDIVPANDNLGSGVGGDTLRTPDPAWQQGQEAVFTGFQHHPRPQLTTSLSSVEYEDGPDLPRPQGGSLLMKEGTATAAGSTVGPVTEHELESTGHEMIVGEFFSSSWDGGENADEGTEPANISVVIDTSGSMEERDTGWQSDDGSERTRLEAAQESAHLFFDAITDGQTVSLVQFDDTTSVVNDAVVVNETTRAELHDAVDDLIADGYTTIGGGMETGMETIQDTSGPQRVLLLSDGEENREPAVADVLPQIQNQGMEVYTIGVGTGINEGQLESIAAQTGANSLLDPDPGRLQEFFAELGIATQGRAKLTETEAMVQEGDVVQDTCRVDASCEDVQFVLSYEGSEMSLVITDPGGNRITENESVTRREGTAHEVWTIDNPDTGEWGYSIEVEQTDSPQRARTQVSSDSQIESELFVSKDLYEQTGFVRFQYKAERDLQRYAGAEAHIDVDPPGEFSETERIELYDDGSGADDVADDGIYSNYYHPTEAGEYEFTTVVEGGEFPNLQRESRFTAQIGNIIANPIRPFKKRDNSSFPTLTALLGFGALAAAYLYLNEIRDSDGDTAGPSPDGPGVPPGQADQKSQTARSQQVKLDSPPDSSILSDSEDERRNN